MSDRHLISTYIAHSYIDFSLELAQGLRLPLVYLLQFARKKEKEQQYNTKL